MSTLTETVRVRVDEQTRAELEQLAEEEGRTLSDLIRRVLSEYAAPRAARRRDGRRGR